jgi:hypothetical protein
MIMRPQIVHIEPTNAETGHGIDADSLNGQRKSDPTSQRQDAFGDEELAEVKYKVLRWW